MADSIFKPIPPSEMSKLSLREFIMKYLNISYEGKEFLCGELQDYISSRDQIVRGNVNIEGVDVCYAVIQFDSVGVNQLVRAMMLTSHEFLEHFFAKLLHGESIDSHEIINEDSFKLLEIFEHVVDDEPVIPTTPSKNRVIH